MSWELVNLVNQNRELPSSEKYVLQALASYSRDEGLAWPSIKTLAEYTNLNPRTVRRLLRSLEERGYLKRSHNGTRSVHYRLSMEVIEGGHGVPLTRVRGTCDQGGHPAPLTRSEGVVSQREGQVSQRGGETPPEPLELLEPPELSNSGGGSNAEETNPPLAATTVGPSPLAAMLVKKKTASEEKRCTMTNVRKAQLAARGIPTDGMSLEQMSARLLECQLAEAESKTQVNGEDYAPT